MGAIAATADTQQLSLLLEGDNLDSDDEAMFESYKKQRMAEMRKEEKRGRFGSVLPLGREDFVREVTEGSREEVGEEGKVEVQDEEDEEDVDGDREGEGVEGRRSGSRRLRGTGVVVFLYKDV